jgi:hypothetical protein
VVPDPYCGSRSRKGQVRRLQTVFRRLQMDLEIINNWRSKIKTTENTQKNLFTETVLFPREYGIN